MKYIHELFRWSLQPIAQGASPQTEPSRQAFNCRGRAVMAGQALPYKALLVQMRGDWHVHLAPLAIRRPTNLAARQMERVSDS
eukprot:5282485-Amphidinium_carterae.1